MRHLYLTCVILVCYTFFAFIHISLLFTHTRHGSWEKKRTGKIAMVQLLGADICRARCRGVTIHECLKGWRGDAKLQI